MFDKNQKDNKLYSDIIRQLYYHKVMACAELSAQISKSIPIVTKALNHLIQADFVVEKGYAASSGGRRPLLYAIKPGKLHLVTVAMDQLSVRIGIIDLLDNFIAPVEIAELHLQDNPDALDTLTGYIKEYINRSGIPKEQLIGIGIGMPGFVNVNEGINYTYLNTQDKPLTQHITDEVGIATYIDNDSSLIALSELKFGIAKSINDVMVINFGWGIGLGMIINGKIFRGHNGFAGEFSHIPVSENGALCSCGKQGCLEVEASLLAVADKAVEGIRNGKKSGLVYNESQNSTIEIADSLMEIANKGDQYAIELISEAGHKIGRGLSILIHIMNPEAIVISGRGAKVGKLLLAPIQQALNRYCIPRLAEGTEILISEIGFDAELIGAAILVMENLGKE